MKKIIYIDSFIDLEREYMNKHNTYLIEEELLYSFSKEELKSLTETVKEEYLKEKLPYSFKLQRKRVKEGYDELNKISKYFIDIFEYYFSGGQEIELSKQFIDRLTRFYKVNYELDNRFRKKIDIKSISIKECGSAITGVDKRKKIKTTGETKTYIYYNCTKRKKGCEKCSQKPIRLEIVEEQISELISTMEIIPEFKDWALNALKDDFNNDVLEKEKILKSLYNSQILSERRLNKLTDSLIDEIITKDEYTVRKKHLQIEINNYREQIEKLNKQKDTSLEITEKVFDFVIRAKSAFNHGNLQTRKEILRGFGWNFELKDGKLDISQYRWFIPIKKLSYELKKDKSSLELIKNSTTKGKSSTISSQFDVWYSGDVSREELMELLDEVENL